MFPELNPERALIFRITHRDNLAWILDNGLHARNSDQSDPNFIDIGNPDLIEKRHKRMVDIPPGGTLSDYIPFYFTPRSPMLFNIKTGYQGIRQRPNEEILIFVSSLRKLTSQRRAFLFTDRHAYLATARYFSELNDLDEIDWTILQNSDFKRDNNDLGKMDRYMAEALVRDHMPTDSLGGIACYNDSEKAVVESLIAQRGLAIEVIKKRRWYF